MSEQDGTQATTAQQPANDDKEAWKVYWKQQSQPWRNEPEINAKQQKYLDERRSIKPDIEKGIYPFGGVKLSRADIEWLLATHENGHGPVDWSDESQRERDGLDLRGADLRDNDLSNLPLTKLRCGLTTTERFFRAKEQWAMARTQMEGSNLYLAMLEGANLCDAQLEGADLGQAMLEGANLSEAQLKRADLSMAMLEGASLHNAQLESASLCRTLLVGADLHFAQLENADLMEAVLEGADLSEAKLKGVNLEGVILVSTDHIGPRLVDVQWGDTNLAVVDWAQVIMLDDEYEAQQKETVGGRKKNKGERLADYKTAVRAYRQLAVILRNQGLNEDAARFAYRAQLMQRKVLWYQRFDVPSIVVDDVALLKLTPRDIVKKIGQYLFSLFLDLLAGYGYKPWRSFLAYLLVITAFAIAYFIIGHTVGPVLSPLGSFVFSMTSFHGRGFFPGGIRLDDPLTVLAALEAFVGLLIEVTFIATLTQRLFGK